MPTNVKVIRTKDKKRVRIGLSFAFNADDPQAAKIYRGIGMCLKEALTDEEQRELLDTFEVERAKLVAVA